MNFELLMRVSHWSVSNLIGHAQVRPISPDFVILALLRHCSVVLEPIFAVSLLSTLRSFRSRLRDDCDCCCERGGRHLELHPDSGRRPRHESARPGPVQVRFLPFSIVFGLISLG